MKSFKGFITTFLLSMLCLLTKKFGGYLVILSFAFLIFFEFKNVKKLGFIIAILLVYMLIIEPKLFEAGGKQEKFSMFFQQTANYVKKYPNDILDNEEVVLKKIFGVFRLKSLSKKYNPVNADYVKGYKQRANDGEYNNYIKVWLIQGLRHPDAYVGAFCSMACGSFSTLKYKPLVSMKENHDRIDNTFVSEDVVYRYGFFKKSSDFISNLYDKIYNIKVIGKIFSWGFWATLAPVFLIITTIKYRKNCNNVKSFVVLIPLILSIVLGIWFSPLSASYNEEGARYLYPVIYTIPLTLLWCFYCIKNNQNE